MEDERFENEESFLRDVLEQLAKRFAQREDLSEVVGGEVRASAGGSCAFAADLHDSNNVAVQENRRADDLLYGLGGFGVDSNAFKYRGVTRQGEIIVDLVAGVAGGARRGCGIDWQGNTTDLVHGL